MTFQLRLIDLLPFAVPLCIKRGIFILSRTIFTNFNYLYCIFIKKGTLKYMYEYRIPNLMKFKKSRTLYRSITRCLIKQVFLKKTRNFKKVVPFFLS